MIRIWFKSYDAGEPYENDVKLPLGTLSARTAVENAQSRGFFMVPTRFGFLFVPWHNVLQIIEEPRANVVALDGDPDEAD